MLNVVPPEGGKQIQCASTALAGITQVGSKQKSSVRAADSQDYPQFTQHCRAATILASFLSLDGNNVWTLWLRFLV